MKICKWPLCLLLALTGQAAISQNTPVPPLEREVTFQVVNEPVSAILQKVEKQARVTFSYNSSILDDKQRVSATFNKKTVEEIIALLFDGKIKCKAKEDHVILTPVKITSSEKGEKKQKSAGTDEKKSVIVHDTIIKVIRDTVYRITRDTVIRHIRDTSGNEKIEFGISTGLNLASADIAGGRFMAGGNGGVFINIRLNRRLSFRQEVLFSMKGYKYASTEEIPPLTLSTSAVQQFRYLEIPFLLKVNITRHFHALCGPYAGILLNAPFTSETNVNGVLNHRESGNHAHEFRGADFGISAGLMYDLNQRMNFGIRYSRGLSNLNRDPAIEAIHHSGISLNIGFRIK